MIKVLIVDDQRLMRDGLSTLLSLEPDMEVIGTAEDGQKGIELALSQDVDVILMDIRMPGVDGISGLQQIHASRPDIRVLMLTTFDDEDDVVRALSSGAVGYLLKDMPGEEIAASIRTAVAGGAVLPPRIARTFLSAVQNSQAPPGHTPVPNAPTGSPAGVSHKPGNYAKPTGTAHRIDSDHRVDTASRVGTQIGGASEETSEDSLEESPTERLTEREQDVLHCLARGMSNREIADTLFVTEGTVKNHVSNLMAKLGLRDRTQAALYAVRHGYGIQ